MSKQQTDFKDSIRQLRRALRRIVAYTGVFFFLLIAAVYGFVVLQINTLSNEPVDQQAVEERVNEFATPSIDEQAAQQLQRLRDNSVNVQTLFDESRTNPFAE